ncbi:nitrogen fixation protein NifZ [Rhodocyclus tenuis]|uniref:Nitrogen fixation protein NifZ n=2 Tax=Rhodocyclus TaxID=1064 RepID=A0A6L5JZS6_RHOTE|nr:nitrogen fixation protein NifZ [Rhodocyclus gracilis]MQY52154.1 nitrogen fixation protein NifZ [Rhodocyclus gracilis]MRD72416.1 nitrogen fixation protein NifZ [Rhodocyclus gracilis]NJA89498.1 nitrogen fixation protein NifZ [Rhodocyclus gracilis]
MNHRWQQGDAVRLIRNVRNDGTYPGKDTGDLLVRRGSVGVVVDVGTFLMDQIIYSVNFLDNQRIVGCREEELQGAEEEWTPSRFETRERVTSLRALASQGEVLVPPGAAGEIMTIERDGGELRYHVHFACRPGRVFAVPEDCLRAGGGSDERTSC